MEHLKDYLCDYEYSVFNKDNSTVYCTDLKGLAGEYCLNELLKGFIITDLYQDFVGDDNEVQTLKLEGKDEDVYFLRCEIDYFLGFGFKSLELKQGKNVSGMYSNSPVYYEERGVDFCIKRSGLSFRIEDAKVSCKDVFIGINNDLYLETDILLKLTKLSDNSDASLQIVLMTAVEEYYGAGMSAYRVVRSNSND